MAISIRLSEEDEKLFRDYAKIHNLSLSDMIRSAVIERIEDEIDLQSYQKALAEYKADPVTFTLDEVEEELGIK